MKIKHSKFKNTGLIYEMLVRQVTSDLMAGKESAAVNILKKYFSGNSILAQEYKLYKTIAEGVNLTSGKAETLIGAVLSSASRMNLSELKVAKYNLISEINMHYSASNFFSVSVPEYRTLAALYCLIESERSKEPQDPQMILNNKVTLLEYMTERYSEKVKSEDEKLLEEISTYDKDLRLITLKVLTQKYNDRYKSLLPEQKNVLGKYITLGESNDYKNFVNSEYDKILAELKTISTRMPKSIEKIKLQEAMKMLEPLGHTDKVSDEHTERILQFYDLLSELKREI